MHCTCLEQTRELLEFIFLSILSFSGTSLPCEAARSSCKTAPKHCDKEG